MTGGVAHDFNNLLMILLGNAEALKRRRGDPDRVAVIAERILAAVQRGETLTRQLLAFGRRSAHAPVSFRLQDRAGDLVELLTRSTGGDIKPTCSIPDDTWPVYADPNALEMALVNLAVNARDAMSEGGTLSIVTRNASLQRERGGTGLTGDFVAIDVTDTGSGIAEEHLGRIFEPFYTTKRNGKGTGLGLSQVYGFAKQSGGDVSIASKLGEGTTVTLYLPRAAEAPALAPVEPAAAAAACCSSRTMPRWPA
jgi:signal transduction histidine kinase